MPNGMSQEEWMRNAIMHPQGAFNDMWSWEKYELGYSAAESIFGWGMRSGNPYIMGFSALTAITLSGRPPTRICALTRRWRAGV